MVEARGGEEEMRKILSFLLLLVVLCSSLSSCKKQSTLSQNKILFTAKKKGYTNIVRLDTKIKSKKIVNSLPFQPEDIVISHDQKKMAIVTITETVGGNKSDIYTMNIDGTNLKNITNALNIPETNKVVEICFSPDNQQIAILIAIRNQNKKDESKIYLVNLDGTKLETYPSGDSNFTQIYQIFFEILHSKNTANSALKSYFAEYNGTLKYNPDKMEFLLHDMNNKSIGIYSWKERKVSPILDYSVSIVDFSWTPDRKSILFIVKVDEKEIDEHLYEFYDVFINNITNKSLTKIMASTKIQFPSILWLPNGKSFIYLIKGSYFYSSLHSSFVEKFDLVSLSSSSLFKAGLITKLEMFTDNQIVIHSDVIDGKRNYFVNLESKKQEIIQYPENLSASGNVFSFINQHILFSQYGFVGYDSKTKLINSQYIAWKTNESLGSVISGETLAPDKSMFYFVYKKNLYLFDLSGKLLYMDVFTPTSFENHSTDSSFLLGFFSSPSEITYLEYVENDNEESGKELNSFNIQTNQLSNLTEALPGLISYQVSPDQQSVALLTKDFGKKIYEVSIMNLNLPHQKKVIKSFPFNEASADSFWDNLYSYAFRFGSAEDAYLYPLFWSNDSQRLFFTSINPHIPKEGEDSIYYPILNQVNVDGSNLKILSKTDFPAFQAHVSPDGKRIVFFQGIKQEVTVMNSKGTGRKILNKQDPPGTYAHPMCSPDSKMIAYYFMDAKDVALYLIVNFNQNIIKKKINFSFKQLDSLLPLLDSNNLFSPNNVYTSFVQSLDLEKNLFQAVLLRNLKEEIPLKGNNISFRWSPIGNQLLLLESKEKYQINQLTLYDCATNTYIPISQDVQQIFDATWSPDGKQILYSGTDSKTGQIVFKTSQADGSNQKVLFTFGENPQERPSTIEKIEKLVWLK